MVVLQLKIVVPGVKLVLFSTPASSTMNASKFNLCSNLANWINLHLLYFEAEINLFCKYWHSYRSYQNLSPVDYQMPYDMIIFSNKPIWKQCINKPIQKQCTYTLITIPDISKIQDKLSDIRSGNLEKLSDRKKTCLTE